jgi:[1-hydroxy-2-(trimethylamino)ethyl]phosphonate dioxygenase
MPTDRIKRPGAGSGYSCRCCEKHGDDASFPSAFCSSGVGSHRRCGSNNDNGMTIERTRMTQDPIAPIAALLEEKGSRRYGLAAVSQLQHALQAALLAEQSGSDAALVTAALLHDIGHMVHGLGEDPAVAGLDDRHEELGRAYLAALFGPAVTEPVRLHVAAKRYLCATEPDYFARLSPDSVRSLALQGGPMSSEEVAAFRALPASEAAVRLRRFDEGAKVEGLPTPPVAHFLPYLRESLGA